MAGERPGFSFLVCPDTMLLKGQLENMLAPFGRFERLVFWGDEEPPPLFWETLALEGLFGGAKLLLARQAQSWPAPVWKKISKVLGRGPGLAWPVFCLEVPFEKGAPKLPAHIAKLRCLDYARERGWLWQCEGVGSMPAYVRKRAGRLGLALGGEALAAFCASVPANAWAVENELARLKLLAPGGAVTEEMVQATGYGPAGSIFTLLRHIEAGNVAGAVEEATRASDAEGLLFPLLAMLARDLRKLWQARAGGDAHFHYREAQEKENLARRLGFTGISRGFALLAEAEWRVKSGRLAVGQTLDWLLVEMCALFAGKRD